MTNHDRQHESMINHPRFKNLGDWISLEYGDQGALADALKPKVAKNTVSSWKTGKNGIPGEYQKQIRKMGYDGPWPQEVAKTPAAPAGVSEREIGKLEGRIEALERVVERLAEAFRHHMSKEPDEAHPQART
jgi:hypothetical protein